METRTDRIQKDIETLATFTSTPGQGVTRSSYSKEDTMAKEYLIGEMKKLNLNIYEDSFGTIFGRKKELCRMLRLSCLVLTTILL